MLSTQSAKITSMANFTVGGDPFVRVDVEIKTTGTLLPVQALLNMGLCRVVGQTDDHLAHPELDPNAAFPVETLGPNSTTSDPDQTIPVGQSPPISLVAPSAMQQAGGALVHDLDLPAGSATLRFTRILSLHAGGHAFWPPDIYQANRTGGVATELPSYWRVIGKFTAPLHPGLVVNRFGTRHYPSRAGFRVGKVSRITSFADYAAWSTSPAYSALAALAASLHPDVNPDTVENIRTLVGPSAWLPRP